MRGCVADGPRYAGTWAGREPMGNVDVLVASQAGARRAGRWAPVLRRSTHRCTSEDTLVHMARDVGEVTGSMGTFAVVTSEV